MVEKDHRTRRTRVRGDKEALYWKKNISKLVHYFHMHQLLLLEILMMVIHDEVIYTKILC